MIEAAVPFAAFLAGLFIAGLTLRDVFETAVVPGGSTSFLSVARRLVFVFLPIYRRVRRKGVGLGFAPFILLLTFVVWLCLLTLAFGLAAYSLRPLFVPALESFGDALYMGGTALTTIGPGKTEATSYARAVIVAAGFCGMAVMTVAVTYLLEVQGAISDRDSGILKLTTTSGEPPSGAGLLFRYAALGCQTELLNILRDGRNWIATVLQSHSTHPSLIYFRSPGTSSGWPASLEAMMDLALILEMLVEGKEAKAPAVLLRQEGAHMAKTLMKVARLTPRQDRISEAEVASLCSALRHYGYSLKEDLDPKAFIEQRERYAGCLVALAHHLGTPTAPLLAEGTRDAP